MKNINKKSGKNSTLLIIGVVVFVLLLGAGAFGYKMIDDSKKEATKLRQENAKLANPQESANLEKERIKSNVAKLIEVPQDEDPTIANVVDAPKLQKEAFYAKAQNGDRALFYVKAKKAFLYRPSSNKIIEVATFNLGNNEKPAAPSGTAPGQ